MTRPVHAQGLLNIISAAVAASAVLAVLVNGELAEAALRREVVRAVSAVATNLRARLRAVTRSPDAVAEAEEAGVASEAIAAVEVDEDVAASAEVPVRLTARLQLLLRQRRAAVTLRRMSPISPVSSTRATVMVVEEAVAMASVVIVAVLKRSHSKAPTVMPPARTGGPTLWRLQSCQPNPMRRRMAKRRRLPRHLQRPRPSLRRRTARTIRCRARYLLERLLRTCLSALWDRALSLGLVTGAWKCLELSGHCDFTVVIYHIIVACSTRR